MPDKGRLFTVFLVVFIGLMGFSLMIPLLPFYAESFGASESMQGLLIASYAIAQLIGAPILGRLSDQYGRRPILLISVLGTFLSLMMLGVANSLEMLFFSRILDGLTGGNISVARAYITDVTDEKNRARGLGLIGMAFGFGFIIGPALGGILSVIGTNFVQPAVAEYSLLNGLNWTYSLPAFAAAAIGLFNLMQVIFQLPESLSAEQRQQMKERKAKRSEGGVDFRTTITMLSQPQVGPLLNLRFFYGYAFSLLQTVFPIYANIQLGLSPSQTAFVLAYVGIGAAIVQGWAVGKLTDRFNDSQLLFLSCALVSPGLLGWGLAPNVPILLIVMIPIIIGGGIFNTIIDSALTKAVQADEAGSVLGVSAALESSTRAIAPSTGGGMIQILGSSFPGILGAGFVGVMAIYTYFYILHAQATPSITSAAIDRPVSGDG